MVKPNDIEEMYSILSAFLDYQRASGKKTIKVTLSERHLSELVFMIGTLKEIVEREGMDDGK